MALNTFTESRPVSHFCVKSQLNGVNGVSVPWNVESFGFSRETEQLVAQGSSFMGKNH